MHAARNAVREVDDRYKRHQPELTLLYQIIETYYPEFLAYMESQGKILPTHIKKEFDAYLKCGRLEYGFIPGILSFTPSGPAFGCSNTFLTYLSTCAL